jgi:xylan 1,4-beta-xylosidase
VRRQGVNDLSASHLIRQPSRFLRGEAFRNPAVRMRRQRHRSWTKSGGTNRRQGTVHRPSPRGGAARSYSEAGVKRVRFHGIFNDELGVYPSQILGRTDIPINFENVDQVYDGLLARGVSPFVELSFMPTRLSSGNRKFGFYGANVSPPASNEAWGSFIKTFVTHLADRYGLPSVRTWLFEVWNEPNLTPFWSGSQQQYFELYKATSAAIKSIDEALQVGGPSTAQGQWVSELATYCAQNNVPLDFISTHVYPGDNQQQLFGSDRFAQVEVVPEVVRRARKAMDGANLQGSPLWLTEWSSDSPAMIANIVSACLPHCHAMSQWALSSTFEEIFVPDFVLKEGDSGWGMMARGIALPAFNTYKLLHALGAEQLSAQGPALASKRDASTIVALIWNLAEVSQQSGLPVGPNRARTVTGETKRYEVQFLGARSGERVRARFVDQERGSPLPAWRAMGSPQYPTPGQLTLLRERADIAPAKVLKLDSARRITFDLPPEGIALLELG